MEWDRLSEERNPPVVRCGWPRQLRIKFLAHECPRQQILLCSVRKQQPVAAELVLHIT